MTFLKCGGRGGLGKYNIIMPFQHQQNMMIELVFLGIGKEKRGGGGGGRMNVALRYIFRL